MAWANEFQCTTGLLFLVTLPPLLLYSDVVMRVLYAPEFLAGAAFAAIFVAAEVFTMLSGTYQSLVIAGDFMRFHVLQNLAAQGLLVLTAAIALPRVGLVGAGLAALAAPVFLFGSTLIFLRRTYGVRPSGAALRTSLLAILVLVVAGGIGSRFPGVSASVLAAKLGVCAVLWLAALATIPAADRARIRHAVARRSSRRTPPLAPRDGVA